MFNDPPDEIREEIRRVGPIRVSRYRTWVSSLLNKDIEPQRIIRKLTDKGFSLGLAEWIVFGVRESVDGQVSRNREIDDLVEPPVSEVLARSLFYGTLLVFLFIAAQILQRSNDLSMMVLIAPLLMLVGLAAVGAFAFSVADLWERWRTRAP